MNTAVHQDPIHQDLIRQVRIKNIVKRETKNLIENLVMIGEKVGMVHLNQLNHCTRKEEIRGLDKEVEVVRRVDIPVVVEVQASHQEDLIERLVSLNLEESTANNTPEKVLYQTVIQTKTKVGEMGGIHLSQSMNPILKIREMIQQLQIKYPPQHRSRKHSVTYLAKYPFKKVKHLLPLVQTPRNLDAIQHWSEHYQPAA